MCNACHISVIRKDSSSDGICGRHYMSPNALITAAMAPMAPMAKIQVRIQLFYYYFHKLPPRKLQSTPTPPVGSRHSSQPAVKLHILPLVRIFPWERGSAGAQGAAAGMCLGWLSEQLAVDAACYLSTFLPFNLSFTLRAACYLLPFFYIARCIASCYLSSCLSFT